jgi:hypothetical protein
MNAQITQETIKENGVSKWPRGWRREMKSSARLAFRECPLLAYSVEKLFFYRR